MGHPQLNVWDALLQGPNEFTNLSWRGRFLQLSVISNRLVKERVAFHNIRERCGIQNEKNRSQDRSLWDSTCDGHWDRATVVYRYCLSSVCEVRGEPVDSSIMCAKDMLETLEKNGAIYRIKAADRSSRVRTDTFSWSRECRRSFVTLNRAVPVLCSGL